MEGHRAQGTGYSGTGTGHRAQGTRHKAQGTRHKAHGSGTWYKAQAGIGYDYDKPAHGTG